MTLKEFYQNIHGDYDKVLLCIPSEEVVARLIQKFPEDSSYLELMDAVDKNDIRAGFEASHKLKGVAANLSFTKLYQAVFALTEQLRLCEKAADPELVKEVERCYQIVIDEINLYERELGL